VKVEGGRIGEARSQRCYAEWRAALRERGECAAARGRRTVECGIERYNVEV